MGCTDLLFIFEKPVFHAIEVFARHGRHAAHVEALVLPIPSHLRLEDLLLNRSCKNKVDMLEVDSLSGATTTRVRRCTN